MKYSPSTRNFYPETINYPNRPDDLVEADWNEYVALHPLPAGKQIAYLNGRLVHEDLPPLPITDLLKQISNKRDKLLRDCDWTPLPDSPVVNNPQWKKYRQDLRDLTNNVANPAEIIWPVIPA